MTSTDFSIRIQQQLDYIEDIAVSGRSDNRKAELIGSAIGVAYRIMEEYRNDEKNVIAMLANIINTFREIDQRLRRLSAHYVQYRSGGISKEQKFYKLRSSTMTKEQAINTIIQSGCETDKISDGYHTFEELYEFRKVYNAALFNEWAKEGKYNVHKSIRHNDGEYCFGGGWFIVVAILPEGQISNHYKNEDWDLFNCPAKDRALFPFDGHTSNDVIQRIKSLYK